ncbi:hypothetical protein [Parafrankia discariae]|uniref:hypothetical protein n=1 Tax=Parafrankia discariae TaxID=365528 RepID=UPI0003699789|nr:hypothetical protein [Parafrankia discariae]
MIGSVRGRIGAVLLAALLAVLAAWYVRDTQRALRQLRVEVRADCAFKRDMTRLAERLPESAGPVTLTISWDAYDAYIRKGCPAELGPLAPPPKSRPPAERG